MNQPIREANPAPAGWLVSPTREFCMSFIRDPKSSRHFQECIHNSGIALRMALQPNLKNARRIDLESAIETWHELLTQEWELMKNQINEDAA